MKSDLPTAILAASLMLSPRALAEAPSPGTVAAAREAGGKGLSLFAAGRWSEAHAAFQAADEAYHAPTLVLYMAHCQKMRGLLVSARALYQRVVDEPLDRGAPAQFIAARATAREEIARLDRRIATLELTLSGDRVSRARLTIDGAPIPAAERATIPLDPGAHAVEITLEGAPPIRRTLALDPGAKVALQIPLPSPLPARLEQGSRLPAYLAFGAASLTATAGIVTGAVSLGLAAGIKASCQPNGHCPAGNSAQAESIGRVADVSTSMFVVAGAALAGGVVLFVVRPSSAAREEGAALRVSVDLRGAFLTGGF